MYVHTVWTADAGEQNTFYKNGAVPQVPLTFHCLSTAFPLPFHRLSSDLPLPFLNLPLPLP